MKRKNANHKGAVVHMEDGCAARAVTARPGCVGCTIAIVDRGFVHDALTVMLGLQAEITRYTNRAKAARRQTERWLASGGPDQVGGGWH